MNINEIPLNTRFEFISIPGQHTLPKWAKPPTTFEIIKFRGANYVDIKVFTENHEILKCWSLKNNGDKFSGWYHSLLGDVICKLVPPMEIDLAVNNIPDICSCGTKISWIALALKCHNCNKIYL